MAQDIPNIILGTQEDYKKLYYSESLSALKVPITLSQGFGVLKMGTVLAKNSSAAGNVGKLVPYDPTYTITAAENAPGRAYLVADSGASSTTLYVAMDDSYKFIVNDDVYIFDSDCDAGSETNGENLGAISAIDRTTYSHMAVITVGTATTDNFTVAKYAYIVQEGAQTAVGILEKSVDTGTGQNAKGALATLILGNCVLYTGMLLNLNSDAATDLSSNTFGQYTYIR